jgi:hypothetical protein
MGISTPSGGGGAPADAEYLTNSTDGTLINETVVSPASEILQSSDIGSSIDPGLSFGSFTQISSTAPVVLFLEMFTRSDGTNDGRIRVDIDESGGTTATYDNRAGNAPAQGGTDFFQNETTTYVLPAGASVRVVNDSDPKAVNAIETQRATILNP